MLRQRARLVAWSVYVADLVVISAAFGTAYWSRDVLLSGSYGPLVEPTAYLWAFALGLPLWSVLAVRFGLYRSFRTEPLWKEPLAILKVCFWGTVLLATATFALRLHAVSRLFLVLFGATAFVFLSIARVTIRNLARSARHRGYNFRNVLIVGTGRRARELASIIEENRRWGLKLLGLVAESPERQTRARLPYPVIGTADRIREVLEHDVVDEVIFAVSRKRLEEFEPLFLYCEELGIRVRVAVNFFPHMIAKVHLDHMQGIPLLTFTTTPYDEFSLAVKRAFDVLIAGLLVVVLSPLLLAIGAAIAATSPGPVLFRQTRIGLNGRRFTLYKFRSMVQDAEARKAQLLHLNEMSGPAFKLARDPRVTRVGAVLRRTSLDELPQLFNVLRGDMSIVGPRPPVPEEVSRYASWQRRRLSMKPGLTCLWQVNGRNRIVDFDRWMELDLQYIDNWSLKLDMKIFLRTIPTVLLGRGAV